MTLLRDFTPGMPHLVLRNDSDLPITMVRVVGFGAMANNFDAPIESIAPGKASESHYWDNLKGLDSMLDVAVAEFDNAAGRTWLRMVNGQLHQVFRYGIGTAHRLDVAPSGRVTGVWAQQYHGAGYVPLTNWPKRRPRTQPTLEQENRPTSTVKLLVKHMRSMLSKPGGWKQICSEWREDWGR